MMPTINWIMSDKADNSLHTFRLYPLIIDTISFPIIGLIIFCVILCISQVDDEPESGDGFYYLTGCVPVNKKT